jgi:hypothetical protein
MDHLLLSFAFRTLVLSLVQSIKNTGQVLKSLVSRLAKVSQFNSLFQSGENVGLTLQFPFYGRTLKTRGPRCSLRSLDRATPHCNPETSYVPPEFQSLKPKVPAYFLLNFTLSIKAFKTLRPLCPT